MIAEVIGIVTVLVIAVVLVIGYISAVGDFHDAPTSPQQLHRNLEWCETDACPAAICNGPHVTHHCLNGDLVASRVDDPTPCPFCGWKNS